MRININRALAVFMLLAVVTSGALAGAALADTTTLAGDGSDQVTNYDANDSDYLETDITADDGTNGFDGDGTETAYMNVTYDGEEYATLEDAIDDGTATSQTLNISQGELAELPGDAGENTTVTVNVWGEDANGNETTAMDTFKVDITFDNSHAVVNVNDDSATIEETELGTFSLAKLSFGVFGDDEPADLHTFDSTVGIDGDNTTVTVYDSTSNGSDAFDEAMSDDLESGDLILGASAAADGTPVLAFEGEADEDIVDTANDTYYVHDNGVWTLHVGDDYSGASEIDVFVESQNYGAAFDAEDVESIFIDQADLSYSDLRNAGFDRLDIMLTLDVLPFLGFTTVGSFGGALFAAGLVVSRRRLSA
ncbi:hypothetical protein ACFQO4_20575 [Saliphagus sp. GCM10025334]